jgi:two-component system NtrC family response regulator
MSEGNEEAVLQGLSDSGLEGMLGISPPMQDVFQTIRKVAVVDVPVLILGESGTGKELAARAIHQLSGRRQGPLVTINCGAIPDKLLESELFGYEKGAFTGADATRRGRIEYAEGGTLFLDEVTELNPPLQVKLLRFLQEHAVERIGGREPIPVNVRVVSATNRDIDRSVRDGQVREDLYYRLSVVSLSLPPLRERGEDLLFLARSFLHRYSKEFNREVRSVSKDAIERMRAYPWPGNVRELENRVKGAVVMAQGEEMDTHDLGLPAGEEAPYSPFRPRTLREIRESCEKETIQEALLRHGNRIQRTAQELGVTRQNLSHLLRKYGLATPDISKRRRG